MNVVGVVLGGGEGRRFGGDKLLALVDGEASIKRVTGVLRSAGADLVYVLTRSGERCRLYTALAGLDGCIYDLLPECSGPGAALASLASLEARYIVVVPGDAPWLSPGIVSRLLGYLGSCDVAAPLHGNGFLETLLIAMHGYFAKEALRVAEALCRLRGDVRPSDYIRWARCSRLVGSALLDSLSPISFSHINTREALRSREARNPLGTELVDLEGGLLRLAVEKPGERCRLLEEEVKLYESKGLLHLARHARRDLGYLCRQG